MRNLNRKYIATVVSCGFVVCLHILSFIVIGHYIISIPEIFQPFTVF